jgi:antitoxin component YwqK of YwqJK toxin-antitoxin module
VPALRALPGLLALLLATACIVEPGREPRLRRVPRDHTGPLQVWWSDERLREEGDYRDGRRHGHVRGFHPDGSVAFEGDFADGVPEGELEQRYPGGALAVREVVTDGILQGLRTEYHENGALKRSSEIVDGRLDGEELRWHPDGELALRGRYAANLPVGCWKAFDERGALTSETWYWTADGEAAGYLETVYDSEGRVAVQTRMLLQDGSWLGRVTMWYPNGAQAGLVETVDGVRHGLDVAWDSTGRKRAEGQRADDLRSGTWTFRDERGLVERTVVYEADKPVLDEPAAGEPPSGDAAPGEAAEPAGS